MLKSYTSAVVLNSSSPDNHIDTNVKRNHSIVRYLEQLSFTSLVGMKYRGSKGLVNKLFRYSFSFVEILRSTFFVVIKQHIAFTIEKIA